MMGICFLVVTALEKWRIIVDGLREPFRREWDMEMLREISNEIDCQEITKLSLSRDDRDEVVWKFTKSGDYQVRYDYWVAKSIGGVKGNHVS
ncbi:hypothetical protein Syun_019262 [Stephania yunnanensis]|uniref:Uncharacterized protein n=1 Tax=Stephania yunnanensis TaxID=152371 RepID=A0AAP0NXT5_9MAGN